MADDISLLLLGAAFASVLPNAAVALYDWLQSTATGKTRD